MWWSPLGVFVIFAATSVDEVTSVTIKVAQGWLKGDLLDSIVGGYQYYSFKGIPYARPPLGNLRFKAPQPPIPWTGLRNARQHGSVCPQFNINTKEYVGNEDCLFLNVYTPTLNPDAPMPVLLFIHGGAFRSGSGNTDFYGPDFQMNLGIVVVTINYRLDALGFLCMNTEDVPGNAGLKDQVAALKWVNENIVHFGGDPATVTIMGQDAGAASLALHFVSPMSAGLFQRGISLSGVPYNDFAVSYKPELRPFILGKQLGLDTQDPDELLCFLQNVPVHKLINTFPSILISEETMRNSYFKLNIFTPVVEKKIGDDNFLTQTREEFMTGGVANKADLLFGHADQESLYLVDDFADSYLRMYDRYPEMLVPRKILMTSTPDIILEVSRKIREHYFGNRRIDLNVIREFVSYVNDAYFNYDIHTSYDILPKCETCRRYFYIFACVSGRSYYGKAGEKYGISGASRMDDLVYIFNANALNQTMSEDSVEYTFVRLTNVLISNFIKYGNPTPDTEAMGIIWPEYNNDTKLYYYAANQRSIRSNPDEAAIEFWNNIYNYAGVSL